MRRGSFSRDQIIERIQQQIESLRQHEHVKQIQIINDFTYNLNYKPSQTNSPYKQNTYTLQLIIPTDYPQSAPSLRFLNQIYHLNIGFNAGQVRMDVLEDEWSPFLGLISLIQRLDKIIQEPDPNYALDGQILDLYQNDHEKYVNKVLQNVSLCEIVLCNSNTKEQSPKLRQSQISGIGNSKYTIQKPYSPNKRDKSSMLVQQLRKSMQISNQIILLSDNIQQAEDYQVTDVTGNFPTIVRAQSKSKNNFPNYQKQKDLGSKNLINQKSSRRNLKMEQKQKIKQQIKTESMPKELLKKNQIKNGGGIKVKTEMSTFNQELKSLTLGKIKDAINIFIDQLNYIEQQIGATKNQGIKILLRQKYDSQIEMLRQLIQLSEDAKKKMIKKLKQQVDQM